MIQPYNLSAFPINYNQDFAVIGDGPSKENFLYNPSVIKVFTINHAYIPLYYSRNHSIINVVTIYHHEEYIENLLNQHNDQGFHLITIQLSDIRTHYLPPGDTANMLIHYLVHKMKSWGVRDKKIYLTGFDYSYEKDWKPQIKSLKYCQIMAEYNDIDIICTSDNPRLSFLTYEKLDDKSLIY